ncbi:MFS transporter [Nonomuraea ferruginea]
MLAIGEFRGLWLGGLLSRAGSQLARVALAVLTYERSGSAAVTTLVYAMTFVPALIGGPALGWLADRYPRREVVIACDAIRTVLIGFIALPGLPLPALCALVFASQLLDSPSRAARVSLTPEVVPRELYQTGVAVHQLSDQVVTLLGFAGGGIVVALVGAETAILINAATFAAAASLTLATGQPAPGGRGKSSRSPSSAGCGWWPGIARCAACSAWPCCRASTSSPRRSRCRTPPRWAWAPRKRGSSWPPCPRATSSACSCCPDSSPNRGGWR